MNYGKIALIITIPGTLVAIGTIYDSFQTNPIMHLELAMPLWSLILSLAGSFGLGVLVLHLYYRKKRGGGSWLIRTGSTELGRLLRQKYGKGFTDDDELIIEAANKGKKTLDELEKFTNLPIKRLKERLKFMKDRNIDEISFPSD